MATRFSGRSIVDLFAGCGGLSLGMEQAGFTPVFVNELNDDARRTYLLNRSHLIDNTPFNELPNLHSADVGELTGPRLEKLLSDLAAIGVNTEKGSASDSDLDVLTGGPPCQGYSGIGHRRSYAVDRVELPSNRLYEKMALLIERIRPRMFLFENVRGILSAKWTSDGKKGEIWTDVIGRFKDLGASSGYEVRWSLVYARDYGVPQNRPRVLIVGMRADVAAAVRDEIDLTSDTQDAVSAGFLPAFGQQSAPDLVDLLGDLCDPDVPRRLREKDFGQDFCTPKYLLPATNPIQRYFRPDGMAEAGAALTEQEYSKHGPRIVEKFDAMLENGGKVPEEYKTKKFAQRLLPERWGNRGPFITATSLPDDYVHFSQPRSLTVREWARLQTFPDWYQFSGKRTTGGLRRAGNPRVGLHDREVPKYTQIGNAVPVLLAQAVGDHFQRLLKQAGM